MNRHDFIQKILREQGHEKENLRYIRKLKRRTLFFLIAYFSGFSALCYLEGIFTAIVVSGMIILYSDMKSLLKLTKEWILNNSRNNANKS